MILTSIFPVVYFALVIGVGLSRRRPFENEADFFLAKRSGSTLLLTGSLLATMLGSFGVMGVSGLAYSMGLVGGWYLWVGAIGLLLLGLWALPRADTAGFFTLPEMLGTRFGTPVRVASACLIVIAWMSIVAAQIIAAGKIVFFLGVAGGWWNESTMAVEVLLIIVSIVFTGYTVLGGQHSILRTDLLQAFFIITALGALLWGSFQSNSGALAALDRTYLRMPFNDSMTPGKWLALLLTFGVPFMVGPDIYSRLLSGRSKEEGRRAVLLTAVLLIPVVLAIALCGVMARAVLGGEIAEKDTVLLSLAEVTVSPIWLGLLAASLLAAVMSSADTCLLTISTLISRDLLDVVAPNLRKESLLVTRGRLIVAIAGVVALLLALNLQSIVSALMIAYKLYSPAVLAPFLAAVIWPAYRFRGWAGVLSVITGGGMAAVGIYVGRTDLQLLAFAASAVPILVDLGTSSLRKHAQA